MRWTPLSRHQPKDKQSCRVLMVAEDLDLIEVEAVYYPQFGFARNADKDDMSLIPAQYWRNI